MVNSGDGNNVGGPQRGADLAGDTPLAAPVGSLSARLREARRARRARLMRNAVVLVLLVAGVGLFRLAIANRPTEALLAQSGTPSVPHTPTPLSGAVHIATNTAIPVDAEATATISAPVAYLVPTDEPHTQAPPTESGTAMPVTATSTAAATIAAEVTVSATTALPLTGRRIGLDPGHGPRGDLGVVLTDPNTGKLMMSEAEFNLDVALRCRDLLVARGATVVLTREQANTFTAPWPSDANGDGVVGASGDDLQERVDILNNANVEAFISIHANGGSAASRVGRDLQVLYCGASDCSFPDQSKQLGQFVLDHLTNGLAGAGYVAQGSKLLNDLDTDPSPSPQHMFLIGPANPPRHMRATHMPGVIAESLYVASAEQAAVLNRNDVRQAIALAYADALQEYLITNK